MFLFDSSAATKANLPVISYIDYLHHRSTLINIFKMRNAQRTAFAYDLPYAEPAT